MLIIIERLNGSSLTSFSCMQPREGIFVFWTYAEEIKKKGGTTQLGKRFVCFAMNAKRIGKKKEIKKKALLK